MSLSKSQYPICILDMPHVVWSGIQKYLKGHESVIYNACLSSTDIEEAVTGCSPRKKLRLLGEKVVTVLVMNYYLNSDDLWKFLQTTSPDLKMFAGANWLCLYQRGQVEDICIFNENVTFQHPNDISLFSDKAMKASNKWLLFRGHNFLFYSTGISTAAEYQLFWEAAVPFLEMFAPFLLSVSVELSDEFPTSERIQNLCMNMLRIIPKLRNFSWRIGTDHMEFFGSTTKTSNRTIEPYLSVEGDVVPFKKTTCFQSFRQECEVWKINSGRLCWNVQQVDRTFWAKIKELILYIEPYKNTADQYTNLLRPDLSNLRNIKKLVLNADSYHWRFLSLLTKFPNVTEVVLSADKIPIRINNDINIKVQENSFPKVTKLTIDISHDGTPYPMDILPTVLPSLRHMCLKLGYNLYNLEQYMKKCHQKEKLNEHYIDVYHLIAENRLLEESNIWNEMDNLKVLRIEKVVQTGSYPNGITENGDDPFWFIFKSEIYTRSDVGSIRFESCLY